MAGERLAQEAEFARPGLAVTTFTGSPLDLVLLLSPYERCILVDAVITGTVPPGTVLMIRADELTGRLSHTYPHAINIPEALQLSRRFAIPLPSSLLLVGIEVDEISTFGEDLSPALAGRWEEIYREVVGSVRAGLDRVQGGDPEK